MNTIKNKPLWVSLFYTKNKDELKKELDTHKKNKTNLTITINNKDNIDNDYYYTDFIMNINNPISDEFSYFSNRYNSDDLDELFDDDEDELFDTMYDDDLENLDADYDYYNVSNYFSDYDDNYTDYDTDFDSYF